MTVMSDAEATELGIAWAEMDYRGGTNSAEDEATTTDAIVELLRECGAAFGLEVTPWTETECVRAYRRTTDSLLNLGNASTPSIRSRRPNVKPKTPPGNDTREAVELRQAAVDFASRLKEPVRDADDAEGGRRNARLLAAAVEYALSLRTNQRVERTIHFFGSVTDLATDVAPFLATSTEVDQFLEHLQRRVLALGYLRHTHQDLSGRCDKTCPRWYGREDPMKEAIRAPLTTAKGRGWRGD